MKRIINCETNEIIERELNEEELAQFELDDARAKADEKKRLAQEAEKQAKKAELLAKLGITEEDAKILLS